jgi:hypothetical protein
MNYYTQINKAFEALNNDLENQAIRATIKISKSKRNKNKDCGFVCGMGGWFWWIEGDSDINPSANRSWQKAFDTYGYLFMTQSLKIVVRNGKILEKSRQW